MITFKGKKYYRDKSTGYYKAHVRAADRDYLHRAVWRHHHGNIPHGWEIHHKVPDLGTTNVADLECLPFREHLAAHIEQLRANGRANVHHTQRKATFVCDECGSPYEGRSMKVRRWCSKQCANRHYRKVA